MTEAASACRQIIRQLKHSEFAAEALALAPFALAAVATLAWLGDL